MDSKFHESWADPLLQWFNLNGRTALLQRLPIRQQLFLVNLCSGQNQ
jgi:hypothetical protein